MTWDSQEKKLAYQRQYRKRPDVRERERHAKRVWATSEKARASKRAWSKANPHKVRAQRLRSTYGITLEQWTALFDSQGRACAICRRKTPTGKGWATDHCHKSGRVRWILCNPCNLAIGHLGERPEVLRRAARLIESMHQQTLALEVGEVPE